MWTSGTISLYHPVINAETTNQFKNRLDKHWTKNGYGTLKRLTRHAYTFPHQNQIKCVTLAVSVDNVKTTRWGSYNLMK